MFFVKVNSHTARKKLFKILGETPKSYYHWDKEGEWYDVGNITDETIDEIKATKGLSVPSTVPNGLRKHVKW